MYIFHTVNGIGKGFKTLEMFMYIWSKEVIWKVSRGKCTVVITVLSQVFCKETSFSVICLGKADRDELEGDMIWEVTL